MINIIITDANIKPDTSNNSGFWVIHPNNDAILARTDTRDEAQRVVDGINDLPRLLRGVGEKCL